MSRLTIVDPATVGPAAKSVLDAVQAQLGVTSNFIGVLANAPAALEGVPGLSTIAGKGAPDAATRERIARAVAEANGCHYCVSAHTVIGRGVGLEDRGITTARHGCPSDPKAAAAVRFARARAVSMGEVSAAEFDAAKAALSEEEIVMIAFLDRSVLPRLAV